MHSTHEIKKVTVQLVNDKWLLDTLEIDQVFELSLIVNDYYLVAKFDKCEKFTFRDEKVIIISQF